ncbi:hemicentin-1-like isoform X2 [Corticium candelabrum]|uniref:hemicentin-1-like isoform X2 n=1 Tax=Corticium candelabrum TaxID=121492 RepID=UPI002E2763B8|nr:hemicentin-1-like isoform X2 [Corticium candelabrum]XP_062513916.1 hemicentin-1-like isoform X2 [Corticium candelabrum]
MWITFELCLLLVFVDMQLLAARRRISIGCTRECLLVQECSGQPRFHCKLCLKEKAVRVKFLMLWCIQCSVCKANQASPHWWNHSKSSEVNLISILISSRKNRNIRQATMSTRTVVADSYLTSNSAVDKTGNNGDRFAGGDFGRQSSSTWTTAVAVVCPALAVITVVVVWFLRKSIRARERQANAVRDEMIPLTEDQLDDETNQPSQQHNSSANQAPWFTEALQSGHAMTGKAITLRCEVEGSQPLVIEWRKDGKELRSMQNHAICIEGTKLTISSMTPELGGQYLCIATNKYGQAITRSTIAVRGTFDEANSNEDIPFAKKTINSQLMVSNPQDIGTATADASVYFNDDIQFELESKYPGGNVRIGPVVEEDESIREYRERMALHTSQYGDSYLKAYQEEKRMAFARQMEEYGYTRSTISRLSGKESGDEEMSNEDLDPTVEK